MTRRGVIGRLAFAVAAVGVVNGVLTLTTLQHDYLTVSLLVLCLAALVDAVATVMAAVAPVTWRSRHPVEEAVPPTDPTLTTYQRLLEKQRVAREPDTGLHHRLLTLAEHRLEQAHGLRRDTAPEEVRARLAPVTEALATSGRLTPADVHRIVDRIEEL